MTARMRPETPIRVSVKSFDLKQAVIVKRVPIQVSVAPDFPPNYAFSMRVSASKRRSVLSDSPGLEPGGNPAC
jgi:hypothetical protein